MLTSFEVKKFKNFEDVIKLDFKNISGHSFNKECIENNIVKKAIIYGRNGVGKSNLGFAIFDIVSHLTDREDGIKAGFYRNYINANFETLDIVEFKYEFLIEGRVVKYCYGKEDVETLVYEQLSIDGEEYLSIDRRDSSKAEINFEGAETLKTDVSNSHISLVSYVDKNALLDLTDENKVFFKFIKFVKGMLFFRSLDQNRYIGYETGSRSIAATIIEKGNLNDFEKFLNESGILCSLAASETNDDILFVFKDKKIPFYDIASTGTRTLALFYYWYQKLKIEEEVTFIYIDEFDAYYHHELAETVVEKLKELPAQIILTTHNTTIMTNELLRPDCYFIMSKNSISPLSQIVDKDLRFGHNIEKMYRAGAFDEWDHTFYCRRQ